MEQRIKELEGKLDSLEKRFARYVELRAEQWEEQLIINAQSIKVFQRLYLLDNEPTIDG